MGSSPIAGTKKTDPLGPVFLFMRRWDLIVRTRRPEGRGEGPRAARREVPSPAKSPIERSGFFIGRRRDLNRKLRRAKARGEGPRAARREVPSPAGLPAQYRFTGKTYGWTFGAGDAGLGARSLIGVADRESDSVSSFTT